VRNEDATFEQLGQLGQRGLGRGRLVDHRLGDAGEALDPAGERRAGLHEGLPAVVQLAPADEHGPDLGQLAGVARLPVRLGVDDEELGGAQGGVEEHGQGVLRPASDAATHVA
jgi:hypothetical protein